MLTSTTISFATALTSAVLLAVLLLHVLRVLRWTRLAQYRSKKPSTVDLLNYARPIEDGIVLNKDGALTACWIYRGPDSGSTPAAERNANAARINQTLATLGSGWMLHSDVVRDPAARYMAADVCHFGDPITAAIDEERRRLFERRGAVYEGFFVLTLTYLPSRIATRRFLELLVDDPGDARVRERSRRARGDRSAEILADFRARCVGVEAALSSTLKLERLRRWVQVTQGGEVVHDEQLRFLNTCVTGLSHPIVLPTQHTLFCDGLIGAQDFQGGVAPKIGEHHIRVVAIEGFPTASSPGLLNILSELPCAYRWSTRFIFMAPHEAEAHYDRYRKKWRQKVVGFWDQVFHTNRGVVDRDALVMVDDAEQGIAEIKSGETGHGYYTSVVVVMDRNPQRADALAQDILSTINDTGFVGRIETVNAIEAYLGSLPAHGVQNIRRPILSTNNLADLLATSTIWTGSATAPCPFYPPNSPPLMHCVTHGATPFRLNVHVDDLGHTLLFGPPGSGKSVHLALLAAQLRRYKGMTVFAFDKGLSMYALTRAIATSTEGATGLHLRLGSEDAPLAFCPLQFLDTRADRAWAMSWIDTILEMNGVRTTPQQRNEIGEAIARMYESDSRSLTEFSLMIQDNQIRDALQQYTEKGSFGQLLDAEHDDLALTDFTVFEIEDLMRMEPKYALPVLLYIFRRIERSLVGQPAAILLDEAWLMLGHSAFRDKIKEWLKVLRKANCAVIMATQSLSDAAGSGILDVIVEACPTKIFLPNPNACDDEAAALYRRMGVNEREVQIIASAQPKRHYYYTSPLGRRVYELAVGDYTKAFVAQSDKESLALIQRFEREYGEQWIEAWLRHLGLTDIAQGRVAA
jgi:type IV secretion system protein TrbE